IPDFTNKFVKKVLSAKVCSDGVETSGCFEGRGCGQNEARLHLTTAGLCRDPPSKAVLPRLCSRVRHIAPLRRGGRSWTRTTGTAHSRRTRTVLKSASRAIGPRSALWYGP